MPWKRPNNGSRMNREVHVRFWESPEVKVLRATRHALPSRRGWQHDRCTSNSRRLATTPKWAESGHERKNWDTADGHQPCQLIFANGFGISASATAGAAA